MHALKKMFDPAKLQKILYTEYTKSLVTEDKLYHNTVPNWQYPPISNKHYKNLKLCKLEGNFSLLQRALAFGWGFFWPFWHKTTTFLVFSILNLVNFCEMKKRYIQIIFFYAFLLVLQYKDYTIGPEPQVHPVSESRWGSISVEGRTKDGNTCVQYWMGIDLETTNHPSVCG